MPALSFKKRFAPAVESGAKCQTIRARRKDGRDPQPGQTLQLYTGMRTKHCRKLGEAECREVANIAIGRNYLRVGFSTLNSHSARDAFARDDGFGCFDEMADYFENELRRDLRAQDWTGIVIYWHPPRLEGETKRADTGWQLAHEMKADRDALSSKLDDALLLLRVHSEAMGEHYPRKQK